MAEGKIPPEIEKIAKDEALKSAINLKISILRDEGKTDSDIFMYILAEVWNAFPDKKVK